MDYVEFKLLYDALKTNLNDCTIALTIVEKVIYYEEYNL